MENATKALLIAAAVLVAILIISLGIGVFNMASDSMADADLTEQQVQAFNDKFLQYEGKTKRGSDVNAMYKTVVTHNNAQTDKSMCILVKHSKKRNYGTKI